MDLKSSAVGGACETMRKTSPPLGWASAGGHRSGQDGGNRMRPFYSGQALLASPCKVVQGTTSAPAPTPQARCAVPARDGRRPGPSAHRAPLPRIDPVPLRVCHGDLKAQREEVTDDLIDRRRQRCHAVNVQPPWVSVGVRVCPSPVRVLDSTRTVRSGRRAGGRRSAGRRPRRGA